jgi:hypothetical protein
MALYYTNGCDSYYSYAAPAVTIAPVTTRVASPCSSPCSLPPYFASYDRPLSADTLAEIESRIQAIAQSCQRTPVVRQERVDVAGPPGRVRNIVRRLPTPAPGKINKNSSFFYVHKQANLI